MHGLLHQWYDTSFAEEHCEKPRIFNTPNTSRAGQAGGGSFKRKRNYTPKKVAACCWTLLACRRPTCGCWIQGLVFRSFRKIFLGVFSILPFKHWLTLYRQQRELQWVWMDFVRPPECAHGAQPMRYPNRSFCLHPAFGLSVWWWRLSGGWLCFRGASVLVM